MRPSTPRCAGFGASPRLTWLLLVDDELAADELRSAYALAQQAQTNLPAYARLVRRQP